MCELERCTVRRTAFSSAILARVARARLTLATFLSIVRLRLLLLRFLDLDLLVRVANALALVRLRTAVGAHFRRNLPDQLAVEALDQDLGLRRRLHLDALGHRVHDG